MKFTYLIMSACAGFAATTASAHEFWIEPPEFQVQADAPFVAELRNGEMFAGNRQSFSDKRNTRIDVTVGEQTTNIDGRMGDRPAIQLPAPAQNGLMILAHEAAPATITYTDWAKFIRFATHKDFQDVEATHTARGWSKDRFTETYTRHSKSLVAVGDGAGSDRALGLATEFVALENPYADGFDGTLDVALMYDGQPRNEAQIEVYARAPDGAVTRTVVRTDARGHAAIPVEDGQVYLLDAVVLRPAPDATNAQDGPVWQTLWASMTFAVPAP
jgi:uncharacterized GH25 family protein